MPTARFSNSFWDKDFNGTHGYELVIKRLKDGRKVSDDFCELIRQRAKVEEEYGRSLLKLAQNTAGTEEIGTLKQSLEDFKKGMENSGNSHIELSRRLLEDVEKNVREFKEKQKSERSKIDDRLKRCQRDKRTAYDNVVKCKRAYEQKCKEKDMAEESMDAKAVWTPKEEEKLRAKLSKSKTQCENADSSYQSAVKMLEDIRKIWERETESGYNQLQNLEEERIKFMRNAMWMCTNLGSLVCIEADRNQENIRQTLEKCSEEVDTQLFIHSKQTGSERPAPIQYENFYHSSSYLQSDLGRSDHAKVISAPINQMAYDSEDAAMMQRCPRYVRAAFAYEAQGPKELSLKEGDVIEVLRIENKEWGFGQISRNGSRGAFPLSFVVQS